MPMVRRTSHAVSGQAANPDASANQPLVNGHGPRSIRSITPPPAAATVQIQAAIAPTVAGQVARDVAFQPPSLRKARETGFKGES